MPAIDYKRQAETALKRLLSNPKISNINKKNFQRYLNAKQHKPARLGIICRHIPFVIQKIPDVAGTMEDRDLVNKTFKTLAQELKPGYYETVKSVSKAFVRWLNDGETPKGWRDITSGAKKAQRRDLTPKDMIRWQEGLKLAAETNSIQLKAVVLTMLDGGFRPSEFVDLNFGDITIKKNFGIAHVRKGKTGKRDVILFKCMPYLQRWLKEHPTKKDGDPLWIIEFKNMSHKRRKDVQDKRYSYFALRKRLKYLFKRAGVNKPCDFYSFRHSAAYLAKMDNTNPELAARKFGHSLEYYTETYARLDAEDDIKRFGKQYGLLKKKEQEEHNPITCPRCNHINDPGSIDCEQCNSALTLGRALDKNKDIDKMKEQMAELLTQQIKMQKNQSEEIKRLKEAIGNKSQT